MEVPLRLLVRSLWIADAPGEAAPLHRRSEQRPRDGESRLEVKQLQKRRVLVHQVADEHAAERFPAPSLQVLIARDGFIQRGTQARDDEGVLRWLSRLSPFLKDAPPASPAYSFSSYC